MRKERKHYTGGEKVAILRRHLLDKVPVSDLCDELGLQPTVSAPDDSSTCWACEPASSTTGENAMGASTYVDYYNAIRLHSYIGYVTPHDMLAERQAEIHAARDRKLEEARRQRQLRREARSLLAHSSNTTTMTSPGEAEAGSAGMQPS